MLYGRYEHNMDAKGRVFVPVKLREKLGETFIAAAVLDRCVSLYSMEEWDSLLSKIAEGPMAQTRKMMRKITELAENVYEDVNGNSKRDLEDLYGFACAEYLQLDSFWSSFDISVLDRTSDGWFEFNVNTDKLYTALGKFENLLHNINLSYVVYQLYLHLLQIQSF